MAEAFLQVVVENLNSLIQREVGLLWGVEKEMEKLSSTLSTIRAVLADAEEKQVKDRALQNWLLKLKDAAYVIDDILDECTTEAFRLPSQGQNSGSVNRVHTFFTTPFHSKNVLFRHNIAKRMKEIRERLDKIAEERMKFHLRVGEVERRVEAMERRQTGSILTQSLVYGRDDDRERIVECLVKDVSNCDDLSIYPIIGMGGLGKTTLAQLVFSDDRVIEHFDSRIWVCISEDFDVKRVLQAIVQSARGKACEVSDLEPLQKHLREILNGEKYLLVLDDVWNEDQEKWDGLKSVLACGSKGASVIVTTRLEKVASIMGTLPLHRLSGLLEDDCWSLFRQRAFGNEVEQHPNIVAIGKEIVKKCGGVPLAAKALGSLMRFKREENEWLSVKESEIWNLPQDENSILPALRLSYYNLPLELRQCFAFCALFPKDSIIVKEDIINLWMANGFISSTGKLEPEDIGGEIWNELYWRSFLEKLEDNFSDNFNCLKMHDLMHDLAQSMVVDECCIMDAEKSTNISKRTRHVSLLAGSRKFPVTIPEALSKVESLRTLLWRPMGLSIGSNARFTSSLSSGYFKLHFLRVFVARGAKISKVSSSIGKLKHLRYLDLSWTNIRMLPESICGLWNLQTLNIEMCVDLQRLPEQMSRLRNLRHLHINDCRSLTQMPPKIGQLTYLKSLSVFIVGERRGYQLGELQFLNLRGGLCIKHLEKVKNAKDAKEANLIGKKDLRDLSLCWGSDEESELQKNVEEVLEARRDLSLCWGSDEESELQKNVEEVLEALEPPPSALECLAIVGYNGTHFPLWMSNQILENLVSIWLSNCKNCLQLPQFGKIPSLKTFSIQSMNCLEYIDNESCSEATRGFPSLEELSIGDLPSLKRWSREEGGEKLCRLTRLCIEKCPKLSLACNEGFPSLISNLHTLTSLSVANNEEVSCFPDGILRNLTALEEFSLTNFTKLQVLPTDLASLTALNRLSISDCQEIECLPEQGLRGLTSLQYLSISNCLKFKSLSEGLQHLTALQRLLVQACPMLMDFPEQGLRGLTSLQDLTINSCLKFKSLSEGLQHLTALQSLQVSNCPMLVDLPGGIKHLNSLRHLRIQIYFDLPEALLHIPSLESLEIWHIHGLASLPDSLGNLTSLKSLSIGNCSKDASLPASIQSLTNLQTLDIQGCSSQLKRRCEKERGEDWYKISHIPHLILQRPEVPNTNLCMKLKKKFERCFLDA